MTLGIADFIRVPLPAARMIAANRDGLIDRSKRTKTRAAARLRDAGEITTHRVLQNVSQAEFLFYVRAPDQVFVGPASAIICSAARCRRPVRASQAAPKVGKSESDR